MPLGFLILLFLFLVNPICKAEETDYRSRIHTKLEGDKCSPSSCGKLRDIRYPFWLKTHKKTHPKTCGDERYSLSCNNNVTTLHLYSEEYLVEAINYENQTIRIVNPNIMKNNCSSLPSYSLSNYNFSYGDPYELSQADHSTSHDVRLTKSLVFVSCENPVLSPLYVDTASCASSGALTRSKLRHSYVVVNGRVSDLVDSCSVELMAMVSMPGNIGGGNVSFMDIHEELAYGIELSWGRTLLGYEELGKLQNPTFILMCLNSITRFAFFTLLYHPPHDLFQRFYFVFHSICVCVFTWKGSVPLRCVIFFLSW